MKSKLNLKTLKEAVRGLKVGSPTLITTWNYFRDAPTSTLWPQLFNKSPLFNKDDT